MTCITVNINCSRASPIIGIDTSSADAPATALVASNARPVPSKLMPAPIARVVAPNKAKAPATATIPAANGAKSIEIPPIAAIATTREPMPRANACHGSAPSRAMGAASNVNAAAIAIIESAVVPI